ncbi:MAG: hypothetical protein M3Q67_06320, partial [Actinomycetota bacterium]|nr:hypothetical protein [Actinomycetota bacterium]
MDARKEPAIDRSGERVHGNVSQSRSRGFCSRRRLVCRVYCLLRALRDFCRLRCYLAAPGFELEQNRLGRLAREPQLSAGRVVAEPFPSYGRHRSAKQLVPGHDRVLLDELLWFDAGENSEAPEALSSSPLEQLERGARIVGENRGSAGAQGGRDSALGPGLDLERSERKVCSTFGKSARGRRKTFLLREDTLEGAKPLTREACLLGKTVSLGRSAPCRHSRIDCLALELSPAVRLAGWHRLERRKLSPEPVAEGDGGLASELEALAPTLQPVKGSDGSLTAAGGVRKLVLRPRAVGKEPFESGLSAAPRERRGVTPNLDLVATVSRMGQVEFCNPRAQRCDFESKLLGPLGSSGLERERSQALAHLLFDIAGALHLRGDTGELELGAMPPALELAEPGGLLDE